jgi:YD repeat-containing protein
MANARGMKPIAVDKASNYTTRMSYSGNNLEYFGKADIGTSSSEEKWQIQKFTYDVNNNTVSIAFADGDDAFDNSWDNRATYTYS